MQECIKIVSKVGHSRSFIYSTFIPKINIYQIYYISTSVQKLEIPTVKNKQFYLKNFLVTGDSSEKNR